MRSIARPLLLLHADATFREQVRRAGGRRFEFHGVPGWGELRSLLREAPPAALIVVDPYLGNNGELAPELRSLLWEFPSVTVIAALDLRPARFRDLRTLGA